MENLACGYANASYVLAAHVTRYHIVENGCLVSDIPVVVKRVRGIVVYLSQFILRLSGESFCVVQRD